jgi:hypothetical protein
MPRKGLVAFKQFNTVRQKGQQLAVFATIQEIGTHFLELVLSQKRLLAHRPDS